MTGSINLEALHYYLSYKHVPTPLSMLIGKTRKPILDVSGIKFSPEIELSEDVIVDKLDNMLRIGIRKVLDADGSIGFLTSGGIDSGIVTAIGAELSKKSIRTFCMTYANDLETEGKRTDRTYARIISDMYKTKHQEVVLDIQEYPKCLPDIIRCFEEPFSGYMSEYFVARLVKPYVGVVLTGDWADELFGSYRTHKLAYQYPESNVWDLRYSHVVFNDEEKKEICNGWAKYNTIEHLKKYSVDLSATNPLNRMLESELRSVFIDQTYLSIDVLSKRHGLRVVGGYSFPDVVDFIARLPANMKMRNGETKYILKKLAERYLPKEIVYRPKEGFITPTLQLVRGLEDYVRSVLSPTNLGKHKLFNIEYVQQLIDDFYGSATEAQSYKLWSLVCFQVWYETIMEVGKCG